jgi:serine/threonine protein kinase
MSGSSVDDLLPIDVRQAIDACCDRFEQAWIAGEKPRLGSFLSDVPASAAQFLLRELIAIEMEYARDESGNRFSLSDVVARHPELDAELANTFAKMPTLRISAGEACVSDVRLAEPATIREFGSRGLHIRCPHCLVALELLDNASLDDINCSVCGSNFSLVDCEHDTESTPQRRHIGRFQLTTRLGVGGFGTVWKARDPELDRDVAIKIPRKGQLDGKEMELFFREARAAAQLRHANIVPVHEVGRDGDTIFIVSDLILGESLASWLKEQNPSTRETMTFLAKVADALHYAHERGVVHRDFKPSNVMIDQEGAPHLMDFGLAKREAGEVTMTIDGQIVGTPAYMSPEQAAGGTHWVDRRTDIYSLGVVLFEVLTGELPFRGNAQMQIRERLSVDPPDPRRLNQRAPRDLSTICLKCLEREPNRRYGTAREVAEELRRFLRGEPIAARPISKIGRLARWSRRNPASAAAMLLTIILAIAGPLAAVLIYSKNAKIASALDENNQLVLEQERKLDELERTNSELLAVRDELLGVGAGERPPAPDFQQTLIGSWVRSHYEKLNAVLADASLPAEAKARGHVGLAYLLADVNENEKAREQLRDAVSILEKLRADSPDNLPWTVGLRDSYALLASLGEKLGDNAASKYRAKAIELSQQIARVSNSFANRIELLNSLTTVGITDLPQLRESINLDWKKETAELHDDLANRWPTDPTELYELACYLTHRPPTLSAVESENAKASSD